MTEGKESRWHPVDNRKQCCAIENEEVFKKWCRRARIMNEGANVEGKNVSKYSLWAKDYSSPNMLHSCNELR